MLIILNTVGGDVEAGLAIAELLSTMKTPTASLVLGGGHSIGVPLAVSCKKSFIVPSATMTVHPVRMNGLVLGVPQTLSYFEKMQDRIVNFVVNNSSIDKKSFKALMMKTGELVMDVGTVLDGEDAVNCGLIDELGGLSDALDFLDKMIEEIICFGVLLMKLIFSTLQNQYVKTILSGQATLTVIYAPVIIWITHIYSEV